MNLLCTCEDCAVDDRVKMGEIQEKDGQSVIVIKDKRHGQKHELVFTLDNPEKVSTE